MGASEIIKVPVRTRRFVIRRFDGKDLEGYVRFMLDDESTRFLAFTTEQKTESGAKALFDQVIAAYQSRDPIHAYAIADNRTDDYVGSCGWAPYEGHIVECYYCVNRECQGRGVAVEAMTAFLSGLPVGTEARAYCHPDNTKAHAVATKCGMKRLGLRRHRHSKLEGIVFVYSAR